MNDDWVERIENRLNMGWKLALQLKQLEHALEEDLHALDALVNERKQADAS